MDRSHHYDKYPGLQQLRLWSKQFPFHQLSALHNNHINDASSMAAILQKGFHMKRFILKFADFSAGNCGTIQQFYRSINTKLKKIFGMWTSFININLKLVSSMIMGVLLRKKTNELLWVRDEKQDDISLKKNSFVTVNTECFHKKERSSPLSIGKPQTIRFHLSRPPNSIFQSTVLYWGYGI